MAHALPASLHSHAVQPTSLAMQQWLNPMPCKPGSAAAAATAWPARHVTFPAHPARHRQLATPSPARTKLAALDNAAASVPWWRRSWQSKTREPATPTLTVLCWGVPSHAHQHPPTPPVCSWCVNPLHPCRLSGSLAADFVQRYGNVAHYLLCTRYMPGTECSIALKTLTTQLK